MEDSPQDWQDRAVARAIRAEVLAKYTYDYDTEEES